MDSIEDIAMLAKCPYVRVWWLYNRMPCLPPMLPSLHLDNKHGNTDSTGFIARRLQ